MRLGLDWTCWKVSELHHTVQDLGHRTHAAGQELVPSISIKFWISALQQSAILLHVDGTLILSVVLSAVPGFLCLFLLWSFSFWRRVWQLCLRQCLSQRDGHSLPSPAGAGDPVSTAPSPHSSGQGTAMQQPETSLEKSYSLTQDLCSWCHCLSSLPGAAL